MGSSLSVLYLPNGTRGSRLRTLEARGVEKAQHACLSEDTVSASSRPTFEGRRNHKLGAAAGTKDRGGMNAPTNCKNHARSGDGIHDALTRLRLQSAVPPNASVRPSPMADRTQDTGRRPSK